MRGPCSERPCSSLAALGSTLRKRPMVRASKGMSIHSAARWSAFLERGYISYTLLLSFWGKMTSVASVCACCVHKAAGSRCVSLPTSLDSLGAFSIPTSLAFFFVIFTTKISTRCASPRERHDPSPPGSSGSLPFPNVGGKYIWSFFLSSLYGAAPFFFVPPCKAPRCKLTVPAAAGTYVLSS